MATFHPRRSGGRALLPGLAALLALPLIACAGAPRPPRDVSAEGENVAFAMDTPSENLFELVGELSVSDVQKETDTAARSARAELRNKAAELGASLVTVDEETGQRVLFQEAVKVTVVGRAYRSR